VETIAAPYPPIDQTDPRLLYVLRNLTAQTASDMGCVYVRNVDTNAPEISAVYPAEVSPMPDWVMMMQWLSERLERIKPNSLQSDNTPQFYSLDETMGFAGAALWAFLIPPDISGGIVLFFKERGSTFTTERAPDIPVLIDLAQTALENQHLVEKLLTTEAMAYTAQAIAKDPSPQSIVHVMRDHIFDIHVSSSTILLYGPADVERPNGPFDYLEIAASWSQELGSGQLIGQTFPLEPFQPWLQQLEYDKKLTIIDLKDFLLTLDSFSQDIIDRLQAQSITILPLQSHKRRLGLLVLTTDKAHEFSAFELRTFQIICEFLTMTTLTEIVQQQSNYVQQIRAALLDAVTNGVLMVHPDERATILTINKQFTEMFGFKEDEAQGASLWALFEDIRVAPHVRRDLLKKWQESGPIQRDEGEFKLVNARGIASDLEWYSAPVYQDKDFIGRIYTFHDVTTKRSAERLRSELLARVSHELRTPLTSISGFAQFILDKEKDTLPDSARQYTEIILKSAHQLTTLFNDMIEITRANAGELKLHMTNASIADIIIETVAKLEMQYKHRKQKVIMGVDDDLPAVYVDIDRLGQVLTNLVYNAIKYGPEKGEIRVTNVLATKRTDLPKSAPQETFLPCIVVSVIDQGAGLNEADAERVFLPFYRTRATRAANIEGVGLGLAVSRSIIELHGGRIWAEAPLKNKPSGRFFFTIPVTEN